VIKFEKAIFEEIIPSMDFDETELKALLAKDVLERFWPIHINSARN